MHKYMTFLPAAAVVLHTVRYFGLALPFRAKNSNQVWVLKFHKIAIKFNISPDEWMVLLLSIERIHSSAVLSVYCLSIPNRRELKKKAKAPCCSGNKRTVGIAIGHFSSVSE